MGVTVVESKWEVEMGQGKWWMASVVLVCGFLAPEPAVAQGSFKREPCFETALYSQPGVPDTMPIGMMSGHPFRKGDGCVPFDLVMTWKESYRDGLDTYQASYTHRVPGALWYRKDKQDFVLHANEVMYKGMAAVKNLSVSGRRCDDEDDGQCKEWSKFGTSQVSWSKSPFGDNQGYLFYGPATTITDPQFDEDERDTPKQFITSSLSKTFHSGDDVWRPDNTEIENAELVDWDYKEFVLAAVEKRPLTKTVTWNRNANPEDAPTPTSGTLSLRFIFDPPCPKELLVRTDRTNYVFSDDDQGTLTIDAEVIDTGNFPTPYLEDVEWDVPDVGDSSVSVDHPGGAKHKVRITYKGLPKKNSHLGKHAIKASVFLGSKCGEVKGQAEVTLFFPRDAMNNPQKTVPNWYYYWQQTSAGHGTRAEVDIKYGKSDPVCALNKWWMGAFPLDRKNFGTDTKPAWALVGRSYVVLCDFAKARQIFPTNGSGQPNDNFYLESRLPFAGSNWEGIDTFGVVTLHELTHRKHWREWWSDGGNHPNGLYPEGGYYDKNGDGERNSDETLLDSDGDHVPDKKEPGFNEDPYYLNLKVTPGNPKSYNIPGDDMTDEHVVTYATSEDPATGWKSGSADKEDWASPGKQWQDE